MADLSRAARLRAYLVAHKKRAALGALILVGVTGGSTYQAACGCNTPTFPDPPARASFFVAQTTAGAADGSSCANAESAAYFNNASHWGSGQPIAPGVTVGLCGTITSDLAIRGSGTAGNPITILFQPGAKLSEPVCPSTGCIWNGAGESYVTIDGGTNGIIENTANGTGLANHTAATVGIYQQDCDHCIVKNLTIRNIYVRTSATDENVGAIASGTIAIYEYRGTNDLLTHLAISDSTVGIYTRTDASATTLTNDEFSYDTFTNIDHNIALGTAGGASGTIGPVLIHHNNFQTNATWDDTAGCPDGPNAPGETCGNVYHHSFVHCFSSDLAHPAIFAGLYIYDNVGTFENNTLFNTGGLYIESSTGGPTPCDSSSSHNYLFNNVILNKDSAYQSGNGDILLGAGNNEIYNNTVVGSSTTGQIQNAIVAFVGATGPEPVVTSKNNVFTTSGQLAYTNVSGYTADYNVYADSGSLAFAVDTAACTRTGIGGHPAITLAQFSDWQACISGDAHSSTTADAKLNSDGTVQVGSPVLGVGTNLTSLCTGPLTPLCSTIDGVSRPATGAWDVGAF
jgi:hypothetical protein